MNAIKFKVLVAEADRMQRDLIGLVVQRLGGELITAGDGERALELIREQAPDVVLLDVFLPRRNGLDILRQIPTRDLDRMLVIIISAMGFPEVVQQAIDLGSRDFLVKPIQPDQLEARLRQLIAIQQPRFARRPDTPTGSAGKE